MTLYMLHFPGHLATHAGGYAKEMSPEFIAAEMELFRQQCADCDIAAWDNLEAETTVWVYL